MKQQRNKDSVQIARSDCTNHITEQHVAIPWLLPFRRLITFIVAIGPADVYLLGMHSTTMPVSLLLLFDVRFLQTPKEIIELIQ